jgi:hypothetical protein
VAPDALCTVASRALAMSTAFSAETLAAVPTVISADWATAVPVTFPASSVDTTTSPPTTSRPW